MCSSAWSALYPVEPADELAVDLAGGLKFLGALCEFLSGPEQRLFKLGQPAAGGAGGTLDRDLAVSQDKSPGSG